VKTLKDQTEFFFNQPAPVRVMQNQTIRNFDEHYRKCVKCGLSNVGKKAWMPSSYDTAIAWTDVTWNTHQGCQKYSEGCANCYADKQTKGWPRLFGKDDKPAIFGTGRESAKGKGWEVILGRWALADSNWKEPARHNRRAEKNNSIILCFSDSMGDYLEDHPYVNSLLPRLWEMIRKTPYIHWLLCTKRAERIAENLPPDWYDYENGYPNVWLGVSIEMAKYAYRFNEHLAKIPAVCRFVSFEPALEPIHHALDYEKLDWCIVGGESGDDDKRRFFDPQWARDIQSQCEANDVKFFYKQDSAYRSSTNPYLDGEKHYNFPMPKPSALPLAVDFKSKS